MTTMLPPTDEERCPRCHALLFIGKLIGSIKCRKCDLMLSFEVRRVSKEPR